MNKQQRKEKLSKIEQAMQFNYKSLQHPHGQSGVKIIKPENYPQGFKCGFEAVEKLERYEARARERSLSKDKVRTKMNRYKSKEEIVTKSLKREISKQKFEKPQANKRERSSSGLSQRKFSFGEFNQEVGKLKIS